MARRTTLLLEREDELSAIDGLLNTACAGSGGGLLLRGPAGIGKTALLEQARRSAEARGMRVLAAVGALLERGYPFGLVRQLFGRLRDDLTIQATLLAGAGSAASAALDGDPTSFQAPDAVFGVTYGLFWALMNLAVQMPVLVCIDDLHWGDDASLRFFDFLLRRIGDAPVAVVSAQRTGEAMSADQVGAFAELEAASLLKVCEPRTLSEDGSLALTRTVMGQHADAHFASACHTLTAGNPFFLSELLDELVREGIEPTASQADRVASSTPANVSRIVLTRLARLGPDAIALARAVAILGDHARLDDAAELAGLPRADAVTATAALVTAGALRDGPELQFVHPLMRDAVVTDIPVDLVAEHHARAARLLAARAGDTDDIAAHTLLSPPAGDPNAVVWLLNAARTAMARAAPEASIKLLNRALAEPPDESARADVLFHLGTAEANIGRPEAVLHIMQARDAKQPGLERAMMDLALTRLFFYGGMYQALYEAAADGRACLSSSDRDLDMALEAMTVIAGTMHEGGPKLSARDIRRLDGLDLSGPGACALAASVGVALTKAATPVDARLVLAERAIEAGGYEMRGTDPFTPIILATLLQWGGRLERAEQLATGVMDQARAINSSLIFTEALGNRAMTRWRAGHLAEAEADARQAMETEGMLPGMVSFSGAAALARVLTVQGRTDEAYRVAAEYVVPTDREDSVLREIALTTLASVELAAGRSADALKHAAQAGVIADAAGSVNPAVSEWRLIAAQALIGLKRHAEAKDMITPALESARASGGAWELGSSLRVAATIHRPSDIGLLREAVAVLGDSEFAVDRAQALIEFGASLRRAGTRREAREPLAEGMELAHRCGAMGLTDQARQELLAAGGRPRRIARTGSAALTVTEHRVAALAADGRANRDIAAELFVSTRTVETHLRNAYGKLGITSRQQLTRARLDPEI